MPRQRVRHEPEKTVLYQVIREHLPGFLQRIEADGSRSPLPRFVVRELRALLECGLLCFGFCRVHCSTCKKDELVAFSCKKRGFCPSCGARRMAETAAHLVDHVLPDVPYRQWVLSLPYRIRFLCAYDPTCASGVRRILTRTISRHYEERARALGVVAPRSGAVVFAQRFDSALRLNLHYHGLWADGTFTCEFAKPRASFFALSQPTDKDVALLVTTIRKPVLRFLKKRGKRASSCRRSSIRDLRNSRRLAVMSLTRNAPLMADVVLDKPRLRYKNGRYLPIAPICSRLTKD